MHPVCPDGSAYKWINMLHIYSISAVNYGFRWAYMLYLHIKLGCPKIDSPTRESWRVESVPTRNESVNDRKLLVFSTHISHSLTEPTNSMLHWLPYQLNVKRKDYIYFCTEEKRNSWVGGEKKRNEKSSMFLSLPATYVNYIWMQFPDSIFSIKATRGYHFAKLAKYVHANMHMQTKTA